MKQVDIIRHAQEYLNQLNNHIDPLSGAPLPAASAAREEDVHKLFYFVSQNLSSIIRCDDKDDRPPFSITPKQRAALQSADKAVGSKELIDQINHAVDRRVCRGLGRTTMLDWLAEQGYLQAVGFQRYAPTPKGQAKGVFYDSSLRFAPSAQQFVFDNLDAISESLQGSVPNKKAQRIAVEHPEILKGNLQAMELLSQGCHPLTKAPLDPRDPLGQERLRKCFAFVARALARSLEVGYFTARQPFSLPRELWAKIPVREAVSLHEFTLNVNALIADPTAVEPLTREPVWQYLTAQGLMCEYISPKGRKGYQPTPQGNALGIAPEERIGADGRAFTTTLYSADAQQYLIDHMADLIALAAR